jgi:hypothetical protein
VRGSTPARRRGQHLAAAANSRRIAKFVSCCRYGMPRPEGGFSCAVSDRG